MTIWKFNLRIEDEFEISVPEEFSPIHIDLQNGTPCLWAQVNPKLEMSKIKINCYGTGHTIREDSSYLGSVIINRFIWHFYMQDLV